MLTNIIDQDFTNFAKNIEENVLRKGIDTLVDYYTQRVSVNETKLVTQYASQLVDNKTPHIPDPRIYLRQNLLALVQDSYALGINDGYKALEDVQFSYKKTNADFALDPNDKLQRDINKLQKDIQASQNIARQSKTLDSYTKTLRGLQNQAEALQNTQATQTLNQLSDQLQSLKTSNRVRSTTKLINQQLQKGSQQQQAAQNTVQQQILTNGSPNTQDYLIKRAIEEKLKYLQNRKDSLASTPPIILEEDKDFFKWYSQKRIVPIANRYQQGIIDKNNEAKKIVEEYTKKINEGTITQTAKGDYQQRVINKILNIEDEAYNYENQKSIALAKKIGRYIPPEKRKQVFATKSIKRVQRVVATELAIAYNVGRLKTYLKAGVQYVTISTSMYSGNKCDYCLDTERESLDKPIKISSLLKNAYKNDGFLNKKLFEEKKPVPIEQRYIPNHPYCMCIYLPHPKKDDTKKQDTQGIYNDPNAWKFILGAGLGVSLVFLAFALTTGRKLDIPTTIPSAVPKITLPVVVRSTAPETIPVDVEPLRTPGVITPDLRRPLSLRKQYETLLQTVDDLPLTDSEKNTVKFDLLQIIRDSSLQPVEQLTKSQLVIEKAATPEYAKQIIDTIANQRGLLRELYFVRFDKVANQFNKRASPQYNINKLQNKVQQVLSKIDGEAVLRAANNIEKTSIDKQIQPIYLLRFDLASSLKRVKARVKKEEADLIYINDLEYRIRDLDNFTAILQRQKREIQNIRDSIVIVDKAMLQQQIVSTQALVDRLQTDNNVLQEAIDQYQDLLEILLALPQKEALKYKKIQTDLNRRIKSAQGITLKRFTGDIVQFRFNSFLS